MTIDWNIGIGAYHESDRVSHSKLRDFAEFGPAYYLARYLTKTVGRRPRTPAMFFGDQFEEFVQRPASFKQRYEIEPEDLDLRKTKEDKCRVEHWKAMYKERPGDIITMDNYRSMEAMLGALREHELGTKLVAASVEQPTILVDHEPFGLQARPDWLCLEGVPETNGVPFSLDLKTCESLTDLMNARSIVRYGYHSQAAMVQRCLAVNGFEECRSFLFAVEKTYPHRAAVIEIEQDLLAVGDEWVQRRLGELARCYLERKWERVIQGITKVGKPSWLSTDAA